MKFRNKSLLTIIGVVVMGLVLTSCEGFLDVKPDKKLAVLSTPEDLQALLNFENRRNNSYPAAGDIASDDYYLYETDWARLKFTDDRDSYIWDKRATPAQDWQYSYMWIFDSNVILDHIDKVFGNAKGSAEYNAIKGSALFFRGFTFFLTAEVFTLPYQKASAGSTLGIPLRLTSDFNDKTVRASQEATYNQALKDLTAASLLLPKVTLYKTRPNRAAAFGALSRVYLVMRNYAKSGAYADSCLQLSGDLIDYNSLDETAPDPFEVFNEEVIFHATNKSNGAVFDPNRARVDTVLYSSYSENDLRKSIFFLRNKDNSIQFKGSYAGSNAASALFSGIATDEMYLIRAECYARQGDHVRAMETLNKLLEKRWKTGTFVPLSSATAEEALKYILDERRKELVLRGSLRWSDLRRLNSEPEFAKPLVRKLGTREYHLPPNDKRYAFLIPPSVVTMTGIQQNER